MQSSNLIFAVIVQLFGSLCFALSAKYQHGTILQELDQKSEKLPISLRGLEKAIRTPRWLFGLLLLGISFGCQIIALTFASVSIVQPIGLLAFPWSVFIQHRVENRKLSKRLTIWVIITVLATVVFTVIMSKYSLEPRAIKLLKVGLGTLIVYLFSAAFVIYGWRGKKQMRALFWGAGGAMLYGLEAALVKVLIEYIRVKDVFWNLEFWVILTVVIAGSLLAGIMVQQGYASGKADVVVASMTITSPVVAVLYGIAVLGEGDKIPFFSGCVIFICALVALGGVVEITRLRSAHGIDCD